MSGSVDVVVAHQPVSNSNPFPVTGSVGTSGVIKYSETTRPANTTAYAALDVVGVSPGAVGSISGAAVANGGSGYITGVSLMTDQSTNTAQYRIHFFHTAPTAIDDNSQYAMLYANAQYRIGSIDIPALTTEGTGSTAARGSNDDARLLYECAAASTTLYYVIETLTAFTPASGQKFTLRVSLDRNSD